MAARVIELRIHGVSNTSPDMMLQDCAGPEAGRQTGERPGRGTPYASPEPTLIAGDEQTGFYRRAAGSADQGTPELATEAYSWGQLTSGSRPVRKDMRRVRKDAERAGWGLLLPFALVNVALWARPDVPGDPKDEGWRSRSTAFLVRLLALSLTATMTLAAVGVAMDQVGWQCRPDDCKKIIGTSFLFRDGIWSQGLRPVAVGMLVPILVMFFIWLLARRSFLYEAALPAGHTPTARDAQRPVSQLRHPHFWSGDGQVRRLSMLHLAAALITVSGVGVAAGFLADQEAARSVASWARPLGIMAIALLVVAFVVTLCTLWFDPAIRSRAPDERPTRGYGRVSRIALGCAFAGSAGAAAFLLLPHHAHPTEIDSVALPGFAAAVKWLLVGQFSAIVLLAVLGGVRSRRAGAAPATHSHSGPVWGGCSAAVLAGAGWATGTLYTAAVLFWTAQWLDPASTVTSRASTVVLPPAVLWSAAGLTFFLLGLMATVLLAWQRLGRHQRPEVLEAVLGEYGDPPGPHERRRAEDVVRWRAVNRLVGENALGAVGHLAVFVAVLSAVAVAGTIIGKPPNLLLLGWRWPEWSVLVAKWLTDVGSSLAGLMLVGLAVLIGLAYRSAKLRRSFGIVWDIATFWPRGAHPFAPPCYAERVVPQLVTRICGVDDEILLAGHSQGAVLSVATILQLPDDRRKHAFLLTFGCQLTRLYGRVFPSFFGAEARDEIACQVRDNEGEQPRWRNLHRLTDPLGWEIGHPDVDVKVTDPAALAPAGGEVTDPPIYQHADYPRSPEYCHERECAIEILAGSGSSPDTLATV
jgi:hypothetical protein